MYRIIKSATASDGRQYVIQVSDKQNHVIGYVRALSRSRHINTLYVDIDEDNAKIYDSAAKAKLAANTFSQFDEIYQYDGRDFLGSYIIQKGEDYGNTHFIDGAKVEVAVHDYQITTATDIKAWSTTEPSASEYGDFMDDRRKRLNDRFAPFKIKDTYMTRGLANSDGYRITLDVDPQYDEHGPYGGAYEEWILHYNRAQDTYELYGSFEPGDIQDTITLFRYEPIKKVKSLNEAMTYLFNNVDVPEE